MNYTWIYCDDTYTVDLWAYMHTFFCSTHTNMNWMVHESFCSCYTGRKKEGSYSVSPRISQLNCRMVYFLFLDGNFSASRISNKCKRIKIAIFENYFKEYIVPYGLLIHNREKERKSQRENEQASKRDMIKIQSRLPFVHRSEIKKWKKKITTAATTIPNKLGVINNDSMR